VSPAENDRGAATLVAHACGPNIVVTYDDSAGIHVSPTQWTQAPWPAAPLDQPVNCKKRRRFSPIIYQAAFYHRRCPCGGGAVVRTGRTAAGCKRRTENLKRPVVRRGWAQAGERYVSISTAIRAAMLDRTRTATSRKQSLVLARNYAGPSIPTIARANSRVGRDPGTIGQSDRHEPSPIGPLPWSTRIGLFSGRRSLKWTLDDRPATLKNGLW